MMQQFADAQVLLFPRGFQYLVGQVVAGVRADESGEFNTQFLAEMLADLIQYIRLAGGGKAADRGMFGRTVRFDELRGIQVIGPEIVPPFGQAVGLVEYPAIDLAVFDGADEAGVAKLLGRHEQDADVAQRHPVQNVGACHHVQHAVECGHAADAAFFQIAHLVHHQRLQR